MKKIIIALIALVFSLSGYAQFMVDNSANIICLSGSAGIGVTNTSINLTSLDVKKVEFSYCFNLAYQHIGRKG